MATCPPISSPKRFYYVKTQVSIDDRKRILQILENKHVEFKVRPTQHCTILFAPTYDRELNVDEIEITKNETYMISGIKQLDMGAVAITLDVPDGQGLRQRHATLKMLLNAIDTHDTFLPHVTIGYLNPGQTLSGDVIKDLEDEFINTKLTLVGERAKICVM